MSDECKIRLAQPLDSALLAGQVYVSVEVLRRKIELGEFLVAELNGVIVGFVQFEYLWSKVPYIALVRVLPEYRLQGIGILLLSGLEDRLRGEGHKMIYSSSQADEAEPQQWHRHVGFTECGFIAGINEGVGEIFFCKELVIE